MKKRLLLLIIFIISCGVVSSQEEKGKTKPDKKQKVQSDTTFVNPILENNESDDEQDFDESESANYIPGILHSSKDVYTNNSSYNFSIAYFKERGYDNRYQTICLNNFQFNNLITGRATFSQWGGLNHVIRYPDMVTNSNPASFSFGDIGGASNYNLRASAFSKQVRLTYSLSNKSYNNRIMLTASTGILKNGWSVTGSLSTRFGNTISYVDGTSYDGYSYFFAAEKKINSTHALNLTILGSPTVRGMQSNSVQETFDLLDDNYYNPNWGWYQGKKRNARVRSTHEPIIMLSHYYTPKDKKLNITTTLASSFGRNKSTSLNWYDVPDPRPDYYRYLPSYFIEDGDTTDMYYAYRDAWLNDASLRQINWDNMYNVNQLAALQGKRAQYMIENRIVDHYLLGGSSNLVAPVGQHLKISAGIDVKGIRQHNYKTIGDLLGGAYWLDVDKYSEGDFPVDADVQYNDLDNKDSKLYEDDIFGYNFYYHIYTQKLWGMAEFTYKHIDFHVAVNVGATEFWRVGMMRNGRYQNSSKGKSEVKSFFEPGIKAGATYKINGRNYLVLNLLTESSAPSILNSFIAPRIHNQYVSNLKNEKIYSADFSYVMNYPVIKLRLTGYFTQFTDITSLKSFYHDDLQTMVNYSMTGIDQRHIGIELGSEIKLGSMFSLIMAGNWGDYRYSNRPEVLINAENGTDFEGDIEQTVYWKNYHVAGSPQVAATLGIKFNYNYWWFNINANYFDKIYCDLNPERRTTNARGTLDENSDLYHQIADQERLKGQFTLDASLSKSWKIKRYTIGFNLSVTNILNNKKLVTTAWEQYRFDYTSYNVNKYQNKYFYAFGTTFFAGLNFIFN